MDDEKKPKTARALLALDGKVILDSDSPDYEGLEAALRRKYEEYYAQERAKRGLAPEAKEDMSEGISGEALVAWWRQVTTRWRTASAREGEDSEAEEARLWRIRTRLHRIFVPLEECRCLEDCPHVRAGLTAEQLRAYIERVRLEQAERVASLAEVERESQGRSQSEFDRLRRRYRRAEIDDEAEQLRLLLPC